MSQPIFNSLGSNYSFADATEMFLQLFFSSPKSSADLVKKLDAQFSGKTKLFYKGRDAIEFLLRVFEVSTGDQVITQAFSCHAIEEAIERVGATPIFADLEKNVLNPSVETLTAAFKKAPKAKAVLIQHTLGFPADIKKIHDWCAKNNLILIEDLAQSFGSKDADGVELGTYADAIICSFGRDKIIDAVSGGAATVKNSAPKNTQENFAKIPVTEKVPSSAIFRDHLYPLLTWIIRNTHHIVVGKILFQLSKKIGLLTSPIASPTKEMSVLPNGYAALALRHFKNLDTQLAHRQKIKDIYFAALNENKKIQELSQPANALKLSGSAALRYPLLFPNPDEIAQKLTQKNIYLTDRWYRKPVDFGSLHRVTVYQNGSCPNAEFLAQHILNLPTHKNITPEIAQKIIQDLAQVTSH